ncbi:MAG TPA: hypothetical protein VF598_09890 [Hymenobacter sp.]|jgi:hypothetical protein
MEEIVEYLKQEDPDYQAGVALLRQHSGNRNRSLIDLLQRKENAFHVTKMRYELAKLAGKPELAMPPLPPAPEEPALPGSLRELQERVAGLRKELNALPLASDEFAVKSIELTQLQVKLALDGSPFTILGEKLGIADASQVDESGEPAFDGSIASFVSELTLELTKELEDITIKMGELYNRKNELSNQLGDAESRADRKHLVDEIDGLERDYNAMAIRKQQLERGELPAEPAAEPEQAGAPDLADQIFQATKEVKNLRSNLSKAKKSEAAATSEAKKSEYAQKVGKLSAQLEEAELTLKGLQA